MKKAFLFLLLIIVLYFLSSFILPQSSFFRNRSIKNQINYLENSFDEGLSEKLQARFPEGKLFGNLIYALSLIEYSNKIKENYSPQIEHAINRCITINAKASFQKNLLLPYGAFYCGWLNYTLKKYIACESFKSSANRQKFIELHDDISRKISIAQNDSITILDTYLNGKWPADNLVCIASLDEEYSELKNKWLNLIYSKSQDELIHHFDHNRHLIRGSSQALIQYFLHDINPKKQSLSHKIYKERFIDKFFSISLVKEYEKPENKLQDVDSGPILFNYGSVATIMNNKLESTLNLKNHKNSFAFLNTLGIPVNLFGNKFYIMKKEPMFDIFMLWCAVGVS